MKLPRRRFLGTSAVALLAGCLGDAGNETPSEESESTEITSADDPTTGGTATDTQPVETTARPTDSARTTDPVRSTETVTETPATSGRPSAEGDPTIGRSTEATPTDPDETPTASADPGATNGTSDTDTPETTPTGADTDGTDTDRSTTTPSTPTTSTAPTTTTSDASAGTGPTRVGFTGDAMLGRSVNEYYASRSPASVWGDMRSRLEALDAVFVNLECCISERGERWPDRTYYFRADSDWAIPALQEIGVGWASLANNHLLDFGPAALLDTVEHLSDAAIANSGAGEDVEAAREPAQVSTGGVDLAFVSFTDNSPEYAAQSDRPGTAYIEMDAEDAETRDVVRGAIEEARASDPDHVVASLHWGPNWVVRPDEQYREFAHWLAEEGVDLIHGHSAHVFQGVEVYDETLILHDTGDFVDDYVVKEDLHNDRSFLFEVTFEDGIRELRLVPIEIDLGVYRAGEEAAAWARSRMRELSGEFGTEFERDGAALVLSLDGI